MKTLLTYIVVVSVLAACNTQVSNKQVSTEFTGQQFTAQQAKDNLLFAKVQYLKLVDHVAEGKHLHLSSKCKNDPALVCFPRAEEDGEIYIEKPKKWTNGFYPGLIWKLLASDEYEDILTDAEEEKLKNIALFYQRSLEPEAKRGSTHDLGFILFDSFGEALEYKKLSNNDRIRFKEILDQGRETLVTRYSEDHKVIKSWDFLATLRIKHAQNGKAKNEKLSISAPWSYPVIIDNMMNLDFLFAENNIEYDNVAFNHAASTLKNHYFYESNDLKKERPLSYHLIDYGSMRPGNWQGMGSISAWARGQAWSFYGFVSVLDALQTTDYPRDLLPDFDLHVDRLFNSVSYLLKDDVVPLWDFFAARDNGNEIASNMDPSTTAYSRILDLCPSMLNESVLPYKGYSPISIDKTMLTKESLARIKSLKSINGDSFIVDDKILPCNGESYDLNNRKIPKDTSAAALLASAMYRYAKFVDDENKKQNLVALADKIMLKLTNQYRTDKEGGKSYDLGFVLTQATGNFPGGSEVNTPIVYGDFYFIEANIRKLQLVNRL